MICLNNKISLEDKKTEIAFNGISDLIKNEDSKIRWSYVWIEKVEDFIEKVINTAELIKMEHCSDEQAKEFGDILAFAGYYYGNKGFNDRKRAVAKAVEDFKGNLTNLETLHKNPEIFYWENSEGKKKILEFCERMNCYFSEQH
jgi:hypothetical protein